MPHFPLFLDLSGKRVLIVGDTPEAKRKSEILAPFHPEIHFLSALTPEDLSPAPALVILTGGNRASQATLCKAANVPVNSADDPENCTFFFPSLICRGNCTVGISSGTSAPAAAKALHRQIEATLPEDLESILPWLSALTDRLRREISDYSRRAEILAAVSAECFQKNRPLNEDELAQYM